MVIVFCFGVFLVCIVKYNKGSIDSIDFYLENILKF